MLDAEDAGEFELTNELQEKIEVLYEEMRVEAIELGKQIIDIEKEIDDGFADKSITTELL